MNWFKNLRIRTKLISGFAVVIIMVLILAIFAVVSIRSVDNSYTDLLAFPEKRQIAVLEANTALVQTRRAVMGITLYSGQMGKISTYEADVMESSQKVYQNLNTYMELVQNDPSLDLAGKQTRIKNINDAMSGFDEYMSKIFSSILEHAKAGDAEMAVKVLEDGSQIINGVVNKFNDCVSIAISTMQSSSDANTVTTNSTIMFVLIIGAAIFVLSMLISLFISAIVTKPITELVVVAEEIAKGDMNVNIRTSSKDETGDLAKSFSSVTAILNSLISEMSSMSKQHAAGQIDNMIDVGAYNGAFSEVADAVNSMVGDKINEYSKALYCITKIVNGDFSANIEKMPGKKAEINRVIDNLRISIGGIKTEISGLVGNALEGKLNYRVDAKKYQGDWILLMDSFNQLMDAVGKPIQESSQVLSDMSKGLLDTRMKGDYKGDFEIIKDSLNSMGAVFSSYISEINDVLVTISEGDLRKGISRDYVGHFITIKDAINTISSRLNNTLTEISSAAEQVLAGARQISSSSMTLAEGASEQASAIEELNASIDSINAQTQDNAKSAKTANELSHTSTENATQGDSEMNRMLESMGGIKESSNSISKIIKTIEDIAFQTNLLALNAAVEAARAGEHGKGFAVVAEEVRNLAARSQNAAKETTAMIEDSITKVNLGTNIARSTASALNTIVENATAVSDIIIGITKASVEQAESISQVSIGIEQISQVVQNNSSTSEESAAAAQELNSQAEMLKQMVEFFKLR